MVNFIQKKINNLQYNVYLIKNHKYTKLYDKIYKITWFRNDYIVIDGKDTNYSLTKSQVKKICHRNYGIGSDGVLLLCKSNKADFGLKIFNPDGSKAEKSGNGLRIFSAFLYEYKKIKNKKLQLKLKVD